MEINGNISQITSVNNNKIEKLSADIDTSKASESTFFQKKNDASDSINLGNQQITLSNQTIEQSEEKIQTLTQQIEGFDRSLANLYEQLSSYQELGLQDKVDSIQAKIDEIQTQKTEKEQEIEQLREKQSLEEVSQTEIQTEIDAASQDEISSQKGIDTEQTTQANLTAQIEEIQKTQEQIQLEADLAKIMPSGNEQFDTTKPLGESLQSENITEVMSSIQNQTMTSHVNPKTGENMSLVDIARFVGENNGCNTEEIGLKESSAIMITRSTTEIKLGDDIYVDISQGGSDNVQIADSNGNIVTLEKKSTPTGDTVYVVTSFESTSKDGDGNETVNTIEFNYNDSIVPSDSSVSQESFNQKGKSIGYSEATVTY